VIEPEGKRTRTFDYRKTQSGGALNDHHESVRTPEAKPSKVSQGG
jgi:hypothetical protein